MKVEDTHVIDWVFIDGDDYQDIARNMMEVLNQNITLSVGIHVRDEIGNYGYTYNINYITLKLYAFHYKYNVIVLLDQESTLPQINVTMTSSMLLLWLVMEPWMGSTTGLSVTRGVSRGETAATPKCVVELISVALKTCLYTPFWSIK